MEGEGAMSSAGAGNCEQELLDITKAEVLSGYVHNLSPIKNGKYFDFNLQTKHQNCRAVCFSPSKRKEFDTFLKAGSPVKIKKFKIDYKSNSEDILLNEGTVIEQCEAVTFKKLALPATMNLSMINNVCTGQLVTVKAKLVNLQAEKTVSTSSGPLVMCEGFLVDPFACVRIVFWGQFVREVREGETYLFKDIRVKKDTMTKTFYVNTAKSGSIVEKTNAFEEVLAIAPNIAPQNMTITGDVIGVINVTQYFSCLKCRKKIEAVNRNILTCSSCNLKQKLKKCDEHWYAQIIFETIPDKIRFTLTLFNEVLRDLFDKDVSLTHDQVLETLLSLDNITLTYSMKNKTVVNITV